VPIFLLENTKRNIQKKKKLPKERKEKKKIINILRYQPIARRKKIKNSTKLMIFGIEIIMP
jgi:hypothetical protein